MLRTIMLSAQLMSADPSSSSYAALNADFEAMKARPEYTAYAEGFGRSRAFPSVATLAACARLASGKITVLVEIGPDGRVTGAAADGDSAAGDCYVNAFLRAQFEPPQFAPLVMGVVFRHQAH
jgi:hypothetical protein